LRYFENFENPFVQQRLLLFETAMKLLVQELCTSRQHQQAG
jgi:hypothetical protein